MYAVKLRQNSHLNTLPYTVANNTAGDVQYHIYESFWVV